MYGVGENVFMHGLVEEGAFMQVMALVKYSSCICKRSGVQWCISQSRVVVRQASDISQFGGLRAVAELWREIVLELRWHWENLSPLMGVTVDNGPDLRCCLLYQKLQMLRMFYIVYLCMSLSV
jgi:hypothetical protein